MSVQERRAREKAKLRSEILSAARELFAREGFENFSMRKLAEKIEYSPTTIYLYFSDKADLLSQVCEDSFAKLVQQLETIASLTTDPVDGLRASMLAYAEFGMRNPANYLATFVLPDSMLPTKSSRRLSPEGAGMRILECLRRTLEDCMRKGKLRKADAEGTAQAIWAAMHGITSLLIAHPDFPWVRREELMDQVIDMTIEGLRV